ncbi:hypothetical protein GCM10010971_35020 [Silvimonas amylolytica]|uniref:Secreted protein n=1 Tax=Silvimonas amylolytica TaxID=449663 RepID=A0ABQ2PQW3_9NEIS|nr:hypothetical protein GCM10010971_35020 [Silvimonas amylolytica]
MPAMVVGLCNALVSAFSICGRASHGKSKNPIMDIATRNITSHVSQRMIRPGALRKWVILAGRAGIQGNSVEGWTEIQAMVTKWAAIVCIEPHLTKV